jgi:YidC/Oxa1 family membrane protein insertase
MELMQPKSDDPAQQQSNAILKVLPLMIGWFSLNVPSALCVYWVVNNIVTTATSIIIRNTMGTPAIVAPGSGSSTATMPPPPPTIFAPAREKPIGFGEVVSTQSKDFVKPITTLDAVIVDEDRQTADVTDDSTDDAKDSSKKRGSSKKKKRKN